MSGGTIKGGNVQIGQDGTATNNFTWYQPAVVDGTIRLGQGVAGATTKDMITVSGSNITLGGNLVQAATAAPAFGAYAAAGSTLTNGAWSKINYATEVFDTNSNYASSRFTPTVAGYYQINGSTSPSTTWTSSNNAFAIFKNGSEYIRGASSGISSGYTYALVSGIVYMNGTTDYVEIYFYQSTGSSQSTQDGVHCSFTGCFLRSA